MDITNAQKVGLEDIVNTQVLPGIKELGITDPDDVMIAIQLIRNTLFNIM